MDTSDKKHKVDKTEKSGSGSKEEKKSRRLSGTLHLHHHHEKPDEKNKEKPEEKHEDKHDKKYYKKKYEEEHKFKLELADVVKKLNATNEALRNEVEALKLQAKTVTKTIKPQTSTEPELVSFSKIDEKPTTEKKPITENPTENLNPNTPKPTSAPTGSSYWDSLSNGLGALYSYVPSFSGITSKIPTVPRILEPVASHHDPVAKPKL